MIDKTMKIQPAGDVAAWLENSIHEFCRDSPENSMRNEENERAFDEPLVGFSNGEDPLYDELKKDIGSPFMIPVEIFRETFPDSPACADELTVISWILPQTKATKADNRKETFYPSERWIRAKHYGGVFDTDLSSYVAELLKRAGHDAVIPAKAPFFRVDNSSKYGFASTWSERHAAYVSGLGTFGLCDGLITSRGKAMLCGSVIVRIRVPPTPRPYTDHNAYCLYFARGTCGLCIKRCPVQAISEQGHDKTLCMKHCFGVTQPYARTTFGIDDYGCGLCQTGVPCESIHPVKHPKDTRIPDLHSRQDRGNNTGNSP